MDEVGVVKNARITILTVLKKVKPGNFPRVAAMLGAGGLLFWGGWSAASRAGNSLDHYGNDFTVFLVAARQFRLTGNPYAHPLAANWPYLYPPLFAELLVPLTFLPPWWAAFIWAIVNTGAVLGLSAIAIHRLGNGWSSRQRVVVMAVWLAVVWRIVVGNLFLGQVNLPIAFLCLLALDRAVERPRLAGAALALAASIKLTPAVLLVVLGFQSRWRALGWTVAWGGLLNAGSLLLLGGGGFAILAEWFQTVVVNGWTFNWATASNQSMRGMVLRLFARGATDVPGLAEVTVLDLGPVAAHGLWIGLALVVLAVSAWSPLRVRNAGSECRFGSNAVALCAVPLVSSLAWEVHFALALPLAAWWCARGMTDRSAVGIVALFSFTFGIGRSLLALWNAPVLDAWSLTTLVTLVGMAMTILEMRRIQDG